DKCLGSMITPCTGPRRSSIWLGNRSASPNRPASNSARGMARLSPAAWRRPAPTRRAWPNRGRRFDLPKPAARLKAMSGRPAEPRWRVLVTPRWIGWHLFAVAAVVGMIWLGDWQLRRALSGNILSWAYTFEWPIFAIFGVVFWVKTVKDELRPTGAEDRQ